MTIESLESELVLLSATVSSPFTLSGAGFVEAQLSTAGTPTPSGTLAMRIPAALRTELGLARGCVLTLTRVPLSRMRTADIEEAQATVFGAEVVSGVDCAAAE